MNAFVMVLPLAAGTLMQQQTNNRITLHNFILIWWKLLTSLWTGWKRNEKFLPTSWNLVHFSKMSAILFTKVYEFTSVLRVIFAPWQLVKQELYHELCKDTSTCSSSVLSCEHFNCMGWYGFKVYLSNTKKAYNFHSNNTAVGHK